MEITNIDEHRIAVEMDSQEAAFLARMIDKLHC